MAVLNMDHINIIALKKDRKPLLETLQRLGMVEVRDAGAGDDIFSKPDTSSARSLLLKDAKIAADALEILDKYSESSGKMLGFLHMPAIISADEHESFIMQKRDAALKDAYHILRLDREITEAKAEIKKLEAQEERLVPWLDLPMPQTFSGTKRTAVFIGSIGGVHTHDSLAAGLAAAVNPEIPSGGTDPVHIEIVSSSKTLTCFYVIALRRDAEAVDAALRSMGFTRPAEHSNHTPAEIKKHCAEQKVHYSEIILNAGNELAEMAAKRDDIRYLEDYMNIRAEKYCVIEKLIQSRNVFILSGYIPAVNSEGLKSQLTSKFECAVEFTTAANDSSAPVSLKNNKFAEPVEAVLENYSMPGRGEVDPVNVMSIFYYIMFGLMFSDAGYGLIMAAVCGFLLISVKDMKPVWRRNITMFFWCGVSTIIWGVVFSSYFGDVVDAVSSTFFGSKVSIPPLWFYPMEKPMALLMLCFAIGIVHLSVGYIMKGITSAKNKDVAGIIYDTVFPIMVILPLVVILMGSSLFENMSGFVLTYPPAVSNACLIVSVACMAGVILTAGRESKNWVKRILKGLYGFYNILAGWLGDILSYSRLLALGLATGVIASVMNSLGVMFGGGVTGAIGFLIVFVITQSLNFGINVLGAYVHSNRLEFVEFFSKFYDGGGQKFAPFGIHSKYYTIKEETGNE